MIDASCNFLVPIIDTSAAAETKTSQVALNRRTAPEDSIPAYKSVGTDGWPNRQSPLHE